MVVLATLLIRQGDLTAARAVAEQAVSVARTYGLGRELGIALQVLGTVQLHQREVDAAAATIADALRALRRDPQPFWIARALELMGVVECARTQSLHAARLFGAAERLRERMGAVLFRLDRERLAPTVAVARADAGADRFDNAWTSGRDDGFDHVVDLAIESVARRPVAPEAPSVIEAISPKAGSAPRSALRARLLGHVTITCDGAEVPDSAWKFARPRELLAYLLTEPDGRTREQISLAFWPDASAAQAKNNVHVTLHHLRRALGRADLVLFQRDRYVINWALGVEVDVDLFERELESAVRALRTNPVAPDAVPRLRAALDLYHGDFLEDEAAGDWHLELRDHLRRRWTDGLTALGNHLLAAGSHADAADVYRRLVRADEWNEAAHRQLMVALALSGQRGEALRHYDRLVALLRRELDAAPARETIALNDRLRRGDLGTE